MLSHSTSAHALLLTGAPGVGKTTLIQKLARTQSGRRIKGFLTEEIRDQRRRQGFHLETFDGRRIILAHTNIQSAYRIGRYGVDVAALEGIVNDALQPDDSVHLYLIDEIGKMECFSQRFQVAITRLLDSGRPVIATIALQGAGFIQRVKERPDVKLLKLTLDNRNDMLDRVLAWIAGE
ncbi:MAG: NTPase [Gammaproteobacteria bacterium]|nr:NTPase [Gammaproteobacteria bacterium]